MKRGAMKNISLAMLARQIGVGVATVDRVLNERGGVSPQTTRKVLQAAREAGLKRILPEEHRFPWQIEVFLSSNDSFFFPQLAQDFAAVADSLGYRRLTTYAIDQTALARNALLMLSQSISFNDDIRTACRYPHDTGNVRPFHGGAGLCRCG